MVQKNFGLVWIAALVALIGLVGCKEEKKYPTAKAPPTLKNINRPASADDDDADDDDDDDDEPVRRPTTPRPPTARNKATGSGGKHVFTRKGPVSINGHPKGPKAEVFNAVLNSVFPRVTTCFQNEADRLQGDRPSIRVRIKIANSGAVSESSVVGGTDNAAVRSCVVSALKGLKFPSYQGRQIGQVVPFTYVKTGTRPLR
jgi:hypothetical protein